VLKEERMGTDTFIAVFAVVVSLGAAYFSWLTAAKSNELSRISALIALREHYFTLFQRNVEFADNHKGMASAVAAAASSAGEAADRLRAIDSRLVAHYEGLIRETRT
jgi:hypothetical protein